MLSATFLYIKFYKKPQTASTTNTQSANTDTTNSISEQKFSPYSASFQIIINGETRTFTDSRYHNKSEVVYIPPEGSRQVQVVVTQPNVSWADLFNTLPMKLSQECIVTGTKQTFCNNDSAQLHFYINGVETPNALSMVIAPDSQLKVVY